MFTITSQHYWYLVAKYWGNPNALSGYDVKCIEVFQQAFPKECALETRTKGD